jgi:toxin FitB
LSYLIDTNVLSELKRKEPQPSVASWVANRSPSLLYLSVLTLGEIRKGIEALSDSTRKRDLTDWLETDLLNFFSGRILSVDTQVADRWGQIVASAGRPLPAIDSLIAATAIEHGLCLVTRNSKDFQYPGLEIINPWMTHSE